MIGVLLADSKKRITNRATLTATDQGKIAVKLKRGWSLKFHFKLRTNTWKLPTWKVEAFMGPSKQQERPKTYRDTKLCSTPVDSIRNQNISVSSFSSAGSKLNSTWDQCKKQTLHQKSLQRQRNFSILFAEHGKSSTFKFAGTSKSQTLGKLASRCILKSTSSHSFLPFNTTQ